MTASFKYLDTDSCAIPDASGSNAPKFGDEFCFDAVTGKREAPVMFRSRRRAKAIKKHASKAIRRVEFIPAYQWVARIIRCSGSVQRPSIGFQVRARGEAHVLGNKQSYGPL